MSGHANPGGTTNSSVSAGAVDGNVNKKRRNNVGKACENCRRRRVKCDGIRPCCGTCRVYKDECSWDPRGDHRKPLSRQQVQALETRVADLERLLRDNGLDPGLAAGPSRRKPEEFGDGQDVAEDVSTVGSGDLREWSQDHLVEGNSGDYQVYGPTSAFRHLSKYSNEGIGGLTLNRGSSPESPSRQPDGFRRYLPQEVQLTQEQHDTALDRFFRYYAAWAQRTHPTAFREDMQTSLNSETPVKTPHYSPMLHNAILAIGLCFSDEPYLRQPAVRKIFAREATTHLESEGMNPTVATVQALAHLASYYSLAAEHNLGWLYIGMALRCAMALGLNMDTTKMLRNGNITAEQARERNVTYWTTFIQEGLWAPYIGRPVNWPEYTAPPPSIDAQLDSLLWTPHDIPGRIVDRSLKAQPGMISSTFVETVKLMQIGARIMNTLYGIKADMATLISSGVISEISLALSTWLERLPPALTFNNHTAKNALPHILMMHLSWAWLVILLHRPFYRPLAGLPANASGNDRPAGYNAALAVKHCDRAAIQIVALLQTWHRLHDLRFTPPTALQCCFIAGTTHLLSFASSRTEKKQADALSRAQECIRLLSHMAVSWPAAHQKQKLLEHLLAEYGMTVSSRQDGKTLAEAGSSTRLLGEDGFRSSHQFRQFDSPPGHVPQTASVPGQPPNALPRASGYADPVIVTREMSASMDGVEIVPSHHAVSTTEFDLLTSQANAVGLSQIRPYDTRQYLPNDNFELQFGNFDFGLPPLDTQQLEADWDPNNFVFSDPAFNPDTQALFDHIIQPHLDVNMHHQPHFNHPL